MPNLMCMTSCYMPEHVKWNMLASFLFISHIENKKTKSKDRKDLNSLSLSSLGQCAISQSIETTHQFFQVILDSDKNY